MKIGKNKNDELYQIVPKIVPKKNEGKYIIIYNNNNNIYILLYALFTLLGTQVLSLTQSLFFMWLCVKEHCTLYQTFHGKLEYAHFTAVLG